MAHKTRFGSSTVEPSYYFGSNLVNSLRYGVSQAVYHDDDYKYKVFGTTGNPDITLTSPDFPAMRVTEIKFRSKVFTEIGTLTVWVTENGSEVQVFNSAIVADGLATITLDKAITRYRAFWDGAGYLQKACHMAITKWYAPENPPILYNRWIYTAGDYQSISSNATSTMIRSFSNAFPLSRVTEMVVSNVSANIGDTSVLNAWVLENMVWVQVLNNHAANGNTTKTITLDKFITAFFVIHSGGGTISRTVNGKITKRYNRAIDIGA